MVALPDIQKTENIADTSKSHGNRTILVVDDDAATRDFIADALQQSGFLVRKAANGLEALQIIRTDYCDLIISDIKMPGMSGIELINKVKEINPAIHIIMITGFPNIDLSISAIKAGAVEFMPKPFDIDELIYKVNIYAREGKLLSEDLKKESIATLKLKQQLHELSTRIYIYDQVEKSKDSNDQIFEEMVDLALKLVTGENCAILLYDVENNRFNAKTLRSTSLELYRHVILPSLSNIFREVIRTKEPLLLNSDEQNQITNSLICVPLMIRNNAFGVLTISKKKSGVEFTEKELSYVVTLSKRASLNLENKILYESAYTNIMDTFNSLTTSIQARDNYTQEHSIRVTELAVKTARVLNFPPQEIESLKVSGMLHDIGKIAVQDRILLKSGTLTEEELAIMKEHPVIGESILKPVLLFDHEIHAIRHHHERWDGLGYPYGLSGYDIPLNARILTVVDAFDAMTNNRPYRKAMQEKQAIDELRKHCDKQFDKLIVEAFLKTL